MSADPFELVGQATAGGVVPGAAIGVITPSGAMLRAAYGVAARVPRRRRLGLEAWFDLASLTKVLFTLREVLRAVEDGLLDLDTRFVNLWPELGEVPNRLLANATPRQLLSHTAGLPATIDLYRWPGSPLERQTRLLMSDWTRGAPVYSDLGFMVLGMALERLRGATLWSRADAGLSFAVDPARAVSTETCAWRARTLRGEVHDENAAALGGRAGHAGLFGSLDGVLAACAALLETRWVSRAAHEAMLEPHTRSHALGWERRHIGWSGGSLAGPASYGHTGFTGTGCWLDPERQLAWVLLTNAVHPRRGDASGLILLRRAVGNAIASRYA